MKQLWTTYRNAYGGLSRASWMLALIQLINRSGSMVLPFLAVYMTTSLGYSVTDAGLIMSVYGVGSLIGSYLGGKLTDKYGSFWVQFNALVTGGICLLLLPLFTRLETLAIAVFVSSIFIETLRPANSTAVSLYASAATLTRSLSLNRMAINLGVSIGPAIGGLLAGISYQWLFIADGITCMLAGLVLYMYFKNKPVHSDHAHHQQIEQKILKPWQDRPFMLMAVCVGIYALLFLQIFQVLPLYYEGPGGFTEPEIGLILAYNGLFVFSIEMALVYYIEQRVRAIHLIVAGTLLCGLSFIVLLYSTQWSVLYLGMTLLSLSEILTMPFMVTVIMQRAVQAARGSYMGVYTMAWALAFIISPAYSTYVIEWKGFNWLWISNGLLALLAVAGFIGLSPHLKKNSQSADVSR